MSQKASGVVGEFQGGGLQRGTVGVRSAPLVAIGEFVRRGPARKHVVGRMVVKINEAGEYDIGGFERGYIGYDGPFALNAHNAPASNFDPCIGQYPAGGHNVASNQEVARRGTRGSRRGRRTQEGEGGQQDRAAPLADHGRHDATGPFVSEMETLAAGEEPRHCRPTGSNADPQDRRLFVSGETFFGEIVFPEEACLELQEVATSSSGELSFLPVAPRKGRWRLPVWDSSPSCRCGRT